MSNQYLSISHTNCYIARIYSKVKARYASGTMCVCVMYVMIQRCHCQPLCVHGFITAHSGNKRFIRLNIFTQQIIGSDLSNLRHQGIIFDGVRSMEQVTRNHFENQKQNTQLKNPFSLETLAPN